MCAVSLISGELWPPAHSSFQVRPSRVSKSINSIYHVNHSQVLISGIFILKSQEVRFDSILLPSHRLHYILKGVNCKGAIRSLGAGHTAQLSSSHPLSIPYSLEVMGRMH